MDSRLLSTFYSVLRDACVQMVCTVRSHTHVHATTRENLASGAASECNYRRVTCSEHVVYCMSKVCTVFGVGSMCRDVTPVICMNSTLC
jgi:hypothetical protein